MKTPYHLWPMRKMEIVKSSLPIMALFLFAWSLTSCAAIRSVAKQITFNFHLIKTLPSQVNPCSLVTKTQAEQILKTSVIVAEQPAIANGNAGQDFPCSYFSSDFTTSAEISLQTHKDV